MVHIALLPALNGRPPPGDLEYEVFALPCRLEGLGIGSIQCRNAACEFQSSLLMTAALTDYIYSLSGLKLWV